MPRALSGVAAGTEVKSPEEPNPFSAILRDTPKYEPGAVLALPDGGTAVGAREIRQFDEQLLSSHPAFMPGEQRPALSNGDWALTSTRLPAEATTEVAHRQADGTWRWIIDRPNVLGD